MSFPKLRKFLVRLLIALASLGVFIPIAVMFLLSGALVLSEGNPLFPPEMNAARVPPGEFVIGDLGGMPVKIPRYFASYVEYDGDPGFGERRPSSPPIRTFESRLSSFGLTFRFPDGAGLSTPDLIADFKKYGDPFWVDYYDPIKSISPWLEAGIWSGNFYPGDGFLDRLSKGTLEQGSFASNSPGNVYKIEYIKSPQKIFGLEKYHLLESGNSKKQTLSLYDDLDLFLHRDGDEQVDVFIKCQNKNMPNLKMSTCLQYTSTEPRFKVGLYTTYPRYWLPRWHDISQLTYNLISSFAAENPSKTEDLK